MELPKFVYVHWYDDGEDSWLSVCEDEREATKSHGEWTLVGKYKLESASEICTVAQPPKVKRRPVKQ